MKCIKKGTKILKVTDEKAERMVTEDGYNYCPRSEWKKIRDAENNRQKEEEDRKKEKKFRKEQENNIISPKLKRIKNKKELRSERNKNKNI